MNIICDLDGTIALDHGRAHLLHKDECPKMMRPTDHSLMCICTSEDRDWVRYFDHCDTDTPCHAIIEILASLQHDHYIYILSGRSHSTLDKTTRWLSDHGVPYNYLQLRATDDRTDDNVLKMTWAKEFGLTPENTLFVLEDRTRMVDAWRAKGFRCFQVAPGNF